MLLAPKCCFTFCCFVAICLKLFVPRDFPMLFRFFETVLSVVPFTRFSHFFHRRPMSSCKLTLDRCISYICMLLCIFYDVWLETNSLARYAVLQPSSARTEKESSTFETTWSCKTSRGNLAKYDGGRESCKLCRGCEVSKLTSCISHGKRRLKSSNLHTIRTRSDFWLSKPKQQSDSVLLEFMFVTFPPFFSFSHKIVKQMQGVVDSDSDAEASDDDDHPNPHAVTFHPFVRVETLTLYLTAVELGYSHALRVLHAGYRWSNANRCCTWLRKTKET